MSAQGICPKVLQPPNRRKPPACTLLRVLGAWGMLACALCAAPVFSRPREGPAVYRRASTASCARGQRRRPRPCSLVLQGNSFWSPCKPNMLTIISIAELSIPCRQLAPTHPSHARCGVMLARHCTAQKLPVSASTDNKGSQTSCEAVRVFCLGGDAALGDVL